MLSVQEALDRILTDVHPVEALTLPLDSATGRVLAQDITASTDLPPFDNSNVDGFALHAADVAQATPSAPRTLDVVADIPAGGYTELNLQPGQAARIMTGAQLPASADAVVMVEDTDFTVRQPGTPAPQKVAVYRAVQPGASIRHRGEDLHAGEHLLAAGEGLRPQEVGLLAMLGIANVRVHRKVRLALFSSGDELLPADAPLAPGKVRDANSYTLAALAEECGAEVVRLGVAADQASAVRSRLERAVEAKADAIVSSAGVSVGAFDYVKAVVEEHGQLDFWQVNMRPGKPLAFGHYRGIPFFGLPGNPVSAFVGFIVFVCPALKRMSGHSSAPPAFLTARLAEPVQSDGRESFLRAVVTEEGGRLSARLTGHQGSGNLFSLVQANALLIVPSGVKSLPANSDVKLWRID